MEPNLVSRCALALVLALPFCGIAAELREPVFPGFSHSAFTTGNALPAERIFKVLQTSDGYLWLGAETGTIRFDGTHAERVLAAPNGAEDYLLLADPDRTLWISRYHPLGHELLRYANGTVTSVSLGSRTYPNHHHGLLVRSMIRDHLGDLWLGLYSGGVLRLNSEGVSDRYGPDRGLPAGASVTALLETPRHALFVATAGEGVFVLSGNKFERVAGLSRAASEVEALASDNEGGVLAGTEAGLFRLQCSGHSHWTATPNSPSVPKIKSLLFDRTGALWIGTGGDAVYRIRDRAIFHWSEDMGLTSGTVRSIAEDREGNIWVATRGGLDRFTPVTFDVLSRANGLPSEAFSALAPTTTGEHWLADWSRGLVRISGRSVMPVANILPEATITNLAPSRSFGLWIGTAQGQVARVTASGLEGLKKLRSRVDALLEAPDGALWIGLRNQRIAVLRDGVVTDPFPHAKEPSVTFVRSLALGSDGSIWIADVFAGLWRVPPSGSPRHYTNLDGLPPDNTPTALYTTRHGQILAAGTGFLSILADARFQTFTSSSGYCGEDAAEIIEDADDGLWIAGTTGIYRLSRQEIFSPFARLLTCRKFNQGDGLISAAAPKYSHPVIMPAGEHRLWFLTTRGIGTVQTDNIPHNTQPPLVTISEIHANGSLVPPSENRLQAGTANVQFAFRALSFAHPQRIRFRYRLTGIDADWRDSTSNDVGYTGLKPGDYTFQVIARNAEGIWSNAGASYSFTILPYFYQTWWFSACCGAFALLAARFAYTLRLRQLRKEFSLVLDERTRLAREIHDTLLQGFAGLAWQLDTVSRHLISDPEGSRQKLGQLLQQMDRCLYEARQAISSMRHSVPQDTLLPHAIEEMGTALVSGSNARLSVEVDGHPFRLPSLCAEHLYAIAREAIVNAVKHASPSTIEVQLRYRDRGVELSVTDDGSGLSPSYEELRHHFGIVGMRERTRLMQGNFTIESREPHGTIVRVSVGRRAVAAAS